VDEGLTRSHQYLL